MGWAAPERAVKLFLLYPVFLKHYPCKFFYSPISRRSLLAVALKNKKPQKLEPRSLASLEAGVARLIGQRKRAKSQVVPLVTSDDQKGIRHCRSIPSCASPAPWGGCPGWCLLLQLYCRVAVCFYGFHPALMNRTVYVNILFIDLSE